MSVVALGSVATVLTAVYPVLFFVIPKLSSLSSKVVPLSLLLIFMILAGFIVGIVAAGIQNAKSDSDKDNITDSDQITSDVKRQSFGLLLSGSLCALAVPVAIMVLIWIQSKEDVDDVARPGATNALKISSGVLWASAVALMAAGTAESQRD